MNLELYRPAVRDLWFKRDLLVDKATMSYNHAWGGTVDFPEELWGRWHAAWVEREGGGATIATYVTWAQASSWARSPTAGTPSTRASSWT